MPLDSGEGVRLVSSQSALSGQPLRHGEYSQASRAVGLGSYFLSGALAVNASQFLGAPLYLINKDWYSAWMAFTKQSFGLLTMTLTQCWAPTTMKISGDASVRGQLLKTVDGRLLCDFPERLILIANHQIYTDWLYLWWIAYCNGMHGRLYIILKESLKYIPVIGWGMRFSQFIFLKRNWEKDKPNMAKSLKQLNKRANAMWLLLFPEGTNLAPCTRAKSTEWAKKNNLKDMQHVLLPRSTGLQFCLQELRETVDYIYDCTIAYEGVPRGAYAQDIFTLKAAYLEGRPPKSVSMYWRRFKISSIPIDNDAVFNLWLQARWREKDYLMELYHRTGRFPDDLNVDKTLDGNTRRGAGVIECQVESRKWWEFLQIFAPMGILALVLYAFYGALPKQFRKAIKTQATRTKPGAIKTAGTSDTDFANYFDSSLDPILKKEKQEKTFKAAAQYLHNLAQAPQTQALITAFPSNIGSDLWRTLTSKDTGKQERQRAGELLHRPPTKGAKQPLNFSEALKNEEARRSAQSAIATIQKAVVPAPRGTFWENLRAEQASRNGSIMTRSASGTGDDASTVFTLPSLRPSTVASRAESVKSVPKLIASATSPAIEKKNSVPQSKSKSSTAVKAEPRPTKTIRPPVIRSISQPSPTTASQPPKKLDLSPIKPTTPKSSNLVLDTIHIPIAKTESNSPVNSNKLTKVTKKPPKLGTRSSSATTNKIQTAPKLELGRTSLSVAQSSATAAKRKKPPKLEVRPKLQ